MFGAYFRLKYCETLNSSNEAWNVWLQKSFFESLLIESSFDVQAFEVKSRALSFVGCRYTNWKYMPDGIAEKSQKYLHKHFGFDYFLEK